MSTFGHIRNRSCAPLLVDGLRQLKPKKDRDMNPHYSLSTIGALVCSLFVLPACGGEETVQAEAQAINRMTQALTIGELQSVNGTYTGCTNRTGAWSLKIASGATLDNPVLSVLLNDAACVLSMTELHTTAGIIAADPGPLLLTTSYTPTPPSFGLPIEFYANARLSAVDFAGDFVLSILYSDNPRVASASNTASFQEVVQASATAEAVPAPDYTIDVAGFFLVTDVNNIVQSATGGATLIDGTVLGQTYVVVNAQGLSTYAELDAAYRGGTPAAVTSTIAAGNFALVGSDLTATQVRTLIIANISSGVASYQAFAITFNPAGGPSSIAPDLGTARTFAVLGASAVTSTGLSVVTGDLGSATVSGFPPGVVNGGVIHVADAAFNQANLDANAAYLSLEALPCDTNLSGQDLGGLTLTPGVYCYATSAQLTGTLTLDAQGDPGAVFVIQAGSTVISAANAAVDMVNGGNPCNVYWQVGSSATLGADASFVGNIVALTSITLSTGVDLVGRALACNAAVTLGSSTVSAASCQAGP